jgi:DDE superfamily endonuclease
VTLSTPTRKLRYLSPCGVGKTHDYRLFQAEFPPAQPWFERFRLRVDRGFLGIEKDDVGKELLIPHKKPRKPELTPAQKAENQGLASQRIIVEHAHAGLKRYRSLADRLHMHNFVLSDAVLGVCAGLWNFDLSC